MMPDKIVSNRVSGAILHPARDAGHEPTNAAEQLILAHGGQAALALVE
jgi:hypothetical protein